MGGDSGIWGEYWVYGGDSGTWLGYWDSFLRKCQIIYSFIFYEKRAQKFVLHSQLNIVNSI